MEGKKKSRVVDNRVYLEVDSLSEEEFAWATNNKLLINHRNEWREVFLRYSEMDKKFFKDNVLYKDLGEICPQCHKGYLSETSYTERITVGEMFSYQLVNGYSCTAKCGYISKIEGVALGGSVLTSEPSSQ